MATITKEELIEFIEIAGKDALVSGSVDFETGNSEEDEKTWTTIKEGNPQWDLITLEKLYDYYLRGEYNLGGFYEFGGAKLKYGPDYEPFVEEKDFVKKSKEDLLNFIETLDFN